MNTPASSHWSAVVAIVAFPLLVVLDALNLIETPIFLSLGYDESGRLGLGANVAIKILLPFILGFLLLVLYRRSLPLFQFAVLTLCLALLPFAYVVASDTLLLLSH